MPNLDRLPPRARRAAPIVAAAAAALAGLAVANKLLAKRAERRYPPRGRFVEVDGVRLHYLEAGEGPPVVFLHGNAATAEDLVVSGVFDQLAETCRVIAFDRPGYGHSERPRDRTWTAGAQADLLREAMIELGIVRPVVVGHSWGTLPALELALRRPDELGGLVLLSGYYFPSPRVDAAVFGGPATPVVGDLYRLTLGPVVGRAISPLIVKAIFAPAAATERFHRDFPIGLALRPSQMRAETAEAAYLVPEAARLSGRLGELHLPVLVAAGDGDRIVRTGQSERLADALPQADFVRLEGGHMIHHIQPDAVANLIESFVRRVGPHPANPIEARPHLDA